MFLSDFLERYLSSRDVSAGYREQMHVALSCLERFAGRQLNVEDLNEELLNDHLRQMRCDGLSDSYRKGRRTNLLVLWRAAADDDMIRPPRLRRVMRIAVADRITRGLRVDEVNRLLTVAGMLVGTYQATGISRAAWWTAYLMVAWDTAARGCDVRRLTREQIAPGGLVVFVQSKTNRRQVAKLWPETLDAINATFPPQRALCFPLWGDLSQFRKEARLLFRAAGVHGTLKHLRSGSASAVEAMCGRGHEHLGNSRTVFERHYRVEDLIPFNRPRPPRLAG